jgi:hypothetical protein
MEAPSTTPPPAATPAANAPADATATEAQASATTIATATKPNGKGTKAKADAKAPTEGATSEAGAEGAKSPEEEFEIVVKGQKRKLTREQAVRELQKGFASEESFRKAKELTQKTQGLLGMLKEKPADALKELGVDVESFARQVLQQRVEAAVEETLPPEEKQARQEKRELEQLRAQIKAREEADIAARHKAQEKQVFSHLEKNIIEAAKRNNMPATPDTLHLIAATASELIDLGVPFTEDQLMAEVRERQDATFGELEKRVLGGLKGEALAQRLGPAVVQEILKWSVERIRGPRAAPAQKQEATPQGTGNGKPSPYMTDAEFRRKYGY